MPLAYATSFLPPGPFWGLVALITIVGIWAAEISDRSWDTHDSGRIVIDEVAGYLVTVGLVDRAEPAVLLVGFFVFRALDVGKPPPVRFIDRRVGGGAGVVLDDVAAGVYGCGLMVAADHLGWLAKLAEAL